MKKNILMKIYESPKGVYFCGSKLFERMATINASCDELRENFSVIDEEKLSNITVDENLEFQISTNDKVFDLLMGHVLENPQIKITYIMDGFTRFKFKFKSEKKAKTFIKKCQTLGVLEWVK